VGKGQLKESCGLEKQNNFFPFKNSPKTECGLDSRIYARIECRENSNGSKVEVGEKSGSMVIYKACFLLSGNTLSSTLHSRTVLTIGLMISTPHVQKQVLLSTGKYKSAPFR
jgi:hypothetical protein